MDILIMYSKDKLFLIKFKATIYKPNEVQSRLFLSLIKFKDRSTFWNFSQTWQYFKITYT